MEMIDFGMMRSILRETGETEKKKLCYIFFT